MGLAVAVESGSTGNRQRAVDATVRECRVRAAGLQQADFTIAEGKPVP
ncbi:MAG: hypothetical protein ACR2RL_12720 [Gammaproteobacteria bacterium]